MTQAFVFPGQGSQAVGMGRALAEAYPEARAVFAAVDDALGQKLSDLMWDGPEDELTLTENAQPALMAVSRIDGQSLRDPRFSLDSTRPWLRPIRSSLHSRAIEGSWIPPMRPAADHWRFALPRAPPPFVPRC